MTKRYWILIGICISLWIVLFPIVVLGESATYYKMETGCYHPFYISRGDGQAVALSNNGDVRVVTLEDNNYNKVIYFVSTTTFLLDSRTYNACGTSWVTPTQRGDYYVIQYNLSYYTYSSDYVPMIHINKLSQNFNDGIYYTFGDGAIDPIEPINWGVLRDVRYTTSIAGSNDAVGNNVDKITWSKNFDSNYNELPENAQVEIRAVRGRYSGTNQIDLLAKKVSDFTLDNTSLAVLGTVNASAGEYSATWSRVINVLGISNWWDLSAHALGDNTWIKEGWIYQARLLIPDYQYEGSWQTIYTGTSASAQASESIIVNSTTYNTEVYQALQTITQVNNNTSVEFVYQNTTINIQNPENTPEPEGGTNIWDILRELINGIFQIIAKLGDIVVGLIDGLFDLFRQLITPPETIDETVHNTFELNINNYIEENQSDLHNLNVHMKQFETDMKSLANQYGSGNATCLVTWEDVTIDLTAFNAGSVTFIQGGSYDFGSTFVDMITAFGISYEQYKFFVSGVIYICLIVFINNRIIWFFRRS